MYMCAAPCSSFCLGDPNDIQLYGLSAGAHSVHQLLHHVSRLPEGQVSPFRSAVLQSNAIMLVYFVSSQKNFADLQCLACLRRIQLAYDLSSMLCVMLSVSTLPHPMLLPNSATLQLFPPQLSFAPLKPMRQDRSMAPSVAAWTGIGLRRDRVLWNGSAVASLLEH